MPATRHEIVSSITFRTVRYPYKLNSDGTRNINRDFDKDEDFLFKFGVNELSLILFRDSPNKLSIDNKEMYFDYSENKLIGIHFEDDDYIWIVKEYDLVLQDCKRLYAAQIAALEMMNMISGNNRANISLQDYIDELPDEFDVPGYVE